MKRVLVTNDDGIQARGLTELVKALGKTCEVYAVAPAKQHSAKAMAITFLREVSVEKTEVEGAAEAYIVDGTPVDCVKWALRYFELRDIKFDYLFSGINLGANVGIAAYYSGTIGAAREGALNRVRSLALSVGTHDSTHFEYICSLAPRLMEISDTLSSLKKGDSIHVTYFEDGYYHEAEGKCLLHIEENLIKVGEKTLTLDQIFALKKVTVS